MPATHRNESVYLTDAILSKLENNGVLLPGCASRVASDTLRGSTTPADAAGKTIEYLAGEQGSRYAEPGSLDARGRAALDIALDVLPIHKSRHSEILAEHGASMAGMDVAGAVRYLAEKLGHRANRSWHTRPPELPIGEQRVLAMLETLRPAISPDVDLYATAAAWGSVVNGRDDASAMRLVAQRLNDRNMTSRPIDVYSAVQGYAAEHGDESAADREALKGLPGSFNYEF